MTLEQLARDLRVLKDVSEIKDITAQYWYSIDNKNPDGLRDVFAPGEIYITFDDMPVWRNREHFAKSFAKFAFDTAKLENHFGLNPKIEVLDETNARALWRHIMFGFNFEQRKVVRVTGDYDIEYVRVEGQWKIRSLIFKRHSFFSATIAADGAMASPDFGPAAAEAFKDVFAGERPAK